MFDAPHTLLPPGLPLPGSIGLLESLESVPPEPVALPGSQSLPEASDLEDVDEWLLHFVKVGDATKRVGWLQTNRSTKKVRLRSNPDLGIGGSSWHGRHTFKHGVVEDAQRWDRNLRVFWSLPEWELVVCYDGEVVGLRCLCVIWLWRLTGQISYEGYKVNEQGDLELQCNITRFYGSKDAGRDPMEVEGGTSWLLGASQNGSVDGSTKTADGVSPSKCVWLTREVAKYIRLCGGVSPDVSHAFMRKKLLGVMEMYPTGLDENDQPLSIAWEDTPPVDDTEEYNSTHGRVPGWMLWAAQIVPIKYIGDGLVQCIFQFRKFDDPYHNNQKRLDIWLRRADGMVITAHPGETRKRSAKLKAYPFGKRP